ncbi:hypothetical protein D3C71_1887710 [compost metagenome]
MIEVGAAADPLAAAQIDLIGDALVGKQVVLRQSDHFATFQNIQINLDGAQRQTFCRAEYPVSPRVHYRFGSCDFIGGVETVEQHLPQTQLGVAIVEGFRVVLT